MCAIRCARLVTMIVAGAAMVLAAAAAPAPAPKSEVPRPQNYPPQPPYKPVAVTIPAAPRDAAFDTLRKDLAGIAQRKDKIHLVARIVEKDFFWERDFSGSFDATKPSLENLGAALSLDNDEGIGWEALAGFASEPSVGPLPGRPSVLCAPAPPQFDDAAFEKLVEDTQTDGLDWMYPRTAGLHVRAAPHPRASVIETVGLALIRTLGFEGGETNTDPIRTAWIRAVTAGGRTGFVAPASLLSPFTDRLCYIKDGAVWKIAGYVGGGD